MGCERRTAAGHRGVGGGTATTLGPAVLGNTPGARLRGLKRPAVTASPIATPALRTLMDPRVIRFTTAKG